MADFNISKHNIVPKHEILTSDQKKEVLEKYGITLKQLPRITDKDPMVKLLEAKIEDVLKITRKSETAGESIYYRVVVKGK